jgi:hypothetical protein
LLILFVPWSCFSQAWLDAAARYYVTPLSGAAVQCLTGDAALLGGAGLLRRVLSASREAANQVELETLAICCGRKNLAGLF